MKTFVAISVSLFVFLTNVNLCFAQTFTPKYTSAIGSNIVGYYEYLPAGYQLPQNATKRYPIIFYFHGGSQLGSSNNNNLEALKAAGIPLAINTGKIPAFFINGTDTFSYIIICPEFKANYPVSDAISVVNYIMSQTQTYRIDAGKVYLTGFSYGGRASWQFIMSSLANAQKIAAIIPIEQYCFPAPDLSTMKYATQSGIGVWALHNTNDGTADPTTCATDYVNLFNSYKPSVPAKITISCIPSASMCGHVDTTQNYIYNPSLYKFPGTSMSVYQWLYQFRQVAAGYPPTANAGPDQVITFPVKQATLNGSASLDIDGTVVSYLWKKISGPQAGSIANVNTSITTVNNLVAGVYSFGLAVTDNSGFTNSDTVKITVVNPAPNILPIANAGQDTTISLPATSCNLNGTASYDPDGDIETYNWQQLSGLTTVAFSSNAIANPVAGNLKKGVYLFQLTVSDNQNATVADTMQLTVKDPFPNVPPVANAGADVTIVLPVNTVTLNGSASSDPDGFIVSYQWRKIIGPQNFTIVSPSNSITAVNNLTAGLYSFELTITDDSGSVRKDTISVTVSSLSKILIDMGGTLTPSPDANGNYWNNMTNATAGVRVANAITTTNVATTVNLVVINRLDGTFSPSGNGTNTGNTIGAVGIYPATATTDYAFAHTSATNGSWEFTGLDSLRIYTIKFWGSKSTSAYSAIQIKRSDSTNWQQYDAGAGGNTDFNRCASFTFTGKKQMIFNMQVLSNSTFGYINVVDINMTSLPSNLPPVANAGVDRTIVLPKDSVNLNGATSFDPQNSPLKYKWRKIGGPTVFQIDDDSISSPHLTALQQGAYQFELKVTDTLGLSGADTINVAVDPIPNDPPISKAGNDQMVTLPLDSVTVDGSASMDIDGSIIAYSWSKISGLTGYQFNDSTKAVTIIRNLTAGIYLFQLTVTDNDGAVGKDTILIAVKAANIPPVANAGIDIAVNLPSASATLNGSASTDVDGSITSYRWIEISGPNQYTISDTTAIQPSLSGLVFGTYLIELTVTDNSNSSSKDTVSITVRFPPNVPPIAKAGNDSVIILPVDSVVLNGSASIDPDGIIIEYRWRKISGPSQYTIADTAAAQTIVDNLVPGIYQFELTVIDDSNATAKDTMQVTLNAANIPPVANAGADQLITVPINSVTLSGIGTDTDGTIRSYLWAKFSGPSLVTITNANSATTTVTGLIAGVYQFILTVTDNSGATSNDTMQVTVNIPPVANAGTDQIITLPINSITFNGSGTDADGMIASYAWTKLSGPSSDTITSAGSATTTVTGLAAGVYQFILTVTDNVFSTGKDTVQVLVNSGAPTTVTDTINVNIYGGANPYNNAAWNNWNIGTVETTNITSPVFTDASGKSSGITGKFGYVLGIADNGAANGATMCPPEVLRYGSYSTSNRVLTINNLPTGSTYEFDFYSSRANTGNSTVYTINNQTKTVVTDNNKSTIVSFTNISPNTSNQVVINISRGPSSTYQYINGFRVIKTTLLARPVVPPLDSIALNEKEIMIYPNPANNDFFIKYNNEELGNVSVTLYNTLMQPVKQVTFFKGEKLWIQNLQINEIDKGFYFIEIRMANSKIVTKLIKQ